MLTDIFAHRYANYPIWSTYAEAERRLMNQTIALAKEIYPYYDGRGQKIESNGTKWEHSHHRLARELGVPELATRYHSTGYFNWDHVCEQFVTALPLANLSGIDTFIKERISFVELVMRLREQEVAVENAQLPRTLLDAKRHTASAGVGMRVPGNREDGVRALNTKMNDIFRAQVDELNERFRRAGAPLTYHNGFIQVATDHVIEREIATPFWRLVAGSVWTNVSIDMAEALDRRDSNDKDPAIFAAKALESAIKIVSDMKGWTRGKETGAAGYIDNLVSKANGSFLVVWEGDMLKEYFKKVRNTLGHGPGSEPMPVLTPAQTDWAIETAMSWIRTLIRRM